jgi:hypothetical protein
VILFSPPVEKNLIVREHTNNEQGRLPMPPFQYTQIEIHLKAENVTHGCHVQANRQSFPKYRTRQRKV